MSQRHEGLTCLVHTQIQVQCLEKNTLKQKILKKIKSIIICMNCKCFQPFHILKTGSTQQSISQSPAWWEKITLCSHCTGVHIRFFCFIPYGHLFLSLSVCKCVEFVAQMFWGVNGLWSTFTRSHPHLYGPREPKVNFPVDLCVRVQHVFVPPAFICLVSYILFPHVESSMFSSGHRYEFDSHVNVHYY